MLYVHTYVNVQYILILYVLGHGTLLYIKDLFSTYMCIYVFMHMRVHIRTHTSVYWYTFHSALQVGKLKVAKEDLDKLVTLCTC